MPATKIEEKLLNLMSDEFQREWEAYLDSIPEESEESRQAEATYYEEMTTSMEHDWVNSPDYDPNSTIEQKEAS